MGRKGSKDLLTKTTSTKKYTESRIRFIQVIKEHLFALAHEIISDEEPIVQKIVYVFFVVLDFVQLFGLLFEREFQIYWGLSILPDFLRSLLENLCIFQQPALISNETMQLIIFYLVGALVIFTLISGVFIANQVKKSHPVNKFVLTFWRVFVALCPTFFFLMVMHLFTSMVISIGHLSRCGLQ